MAIVPEIVTSGRNRGYLEIDTKVQEVYILASVGFGLVGLAVVADSVLRGGDAWTAIGTGTMALPHAAVLARAIFRR